MKKAPFLILPCVWDFKKKQNRDIIIDTNLSLAKINEVNKKVYKKFTITNDKFGNKMPPHSQKFFLSRTTIGAEQYSYSSIKDTLNKFGIEKEEYESEGLFVLRATLMNPWYYESSLEDNLVRSTDYFFEFIKEINKVAIEVLETINFNKQ